MWHAFVYRSLSGKESNRWLTDAKGGKAKITIANVMQSNGMIHVIGTMLMPWCARGGAALHWFRLAERKGNDLVVPVLSEESQPKTPQPHERRPSVLLVEDEELLRHILGESLEDAGYRVTLALEGFGMPQLDSCC